MTPKMTVVKKIKQFCKNCQEVKEGFEGFIQLGKTVHKCIFCVGCERLAHDPKPMPVN